MQVVASRSGCMQVNVGDPRFQGLFTSQDFALDPTDPQFSKAPGGPAILAEAARRKGSAQPGESAPGMNVPVPLPAKC